MFVMKSIPILYLEPYPTPLLPFELSWVIQMQVLDSVK